MYYIILIHYYITMIRIIFPIIFPIISQRTIISLYYITIISIIFTIISDYIRVLHPIFQELADTNCRPMHPEMTDKSPAASSQLLDDQASSPYEARPTYSAKRRLLYALFRVLYLLFWMSVQDLAAWNLNWCNKPMRGIMPSHQEEHSPFCLMGPIHALFFCIICIISLLYHP